MFSGWRVVTPNVKLDYRVPLESNPLQVRTNSTKGSDDKIDIYFAGTRTWIYFKDYSYFLSHCTSNTASRRPKLSNVPHGRDKIWTFTKSSTSLTISCNDIEVAKLVFEEVDKTKYRQCVNRWKPVNNIKTIFFGGTTVKQYRPKPGNDILTLYHL